MGKNADKTWKKRVPARVRKMLLAKFGKSLSGRQWRKLRKFLQRPENV